MGIAEASAEMVVARRRPIANRRQHRLRVLGDALVRRLEDVIEADARPPSSLLDESRRFLLEVTLTFGGTPRRTNSRDPRVLLDRVFTAIEEAERRAGSEGCPW